MTWSFNLRVNTCHANHAHPNHANRADLTSWSVNQSVYCWILSDILLVHFIRNAESDWTPMCASFLNENQMWRTGILCSGIIRRQRLVMKTF
jgi:hypothetical protein